MPALILLFAALLVYSPLLGFVLPHGGVATFGTSREKNSFQPQGTVFRNIGLLRILPPEALYNRAGTWFLPLPADAIVRLLIPSAAQLPAAPRKLHIEKT